MPLFRPNTAVLQPVFYMFTRCMLCVGNRLKPWKNQLNPLQTQWKLGKNRWKLWVNQWTPWKNRWAVQMANLQYSAKYMFCSKMPQTEKQKKNMHPFLCQYLLGCGGIIWNALCDNSLYVTRFKLAHLWSLTLAEKVRDFPTVATSYLIVTTRCDYISCRQCQNPISELWEAKDPKHPWRVVAPCLASSEARISLNARLMVETHGNW